MDTLPQNVLNLIAEFVPAADDATRAVVIKADPYDPIVITTMLDLGIDPYAIIAEKREQIRRAKEAETCPIHRLVRILNGDDPVNGWIASVDLDDDTQVWIERTAPIPFPVDAVRDLGYSVQIDDDYSHSAVFRVENPSDFLDALIRADEYLTPISAPGKAPYYSRGYGN
jgi:hypothetical protein